MCLNHKFIFRIEKVGYYRENPGGYTGRIECKDQRLILFTTFEFTLKRWPATNG